MTRLQLGPGRRVPAWTGSYVDYEQMHAATGSTKNCIREGDRRCVVRGASEDTPAGTTDKRLGTAAAQQNAEYRQTAQGQQGFVCDGNENTHPLSNLARFRRGPSTSVVAAAAMVLTVLAP